MKKYTEEEIEAKRKELSKEMTVEYITQMFVSSMMHFQDVTIQSLKKNKLYNHDFFFQSDDELYAKAKEYLKCNNYGRALNHYQNDLKQ